MSEDSHIPILPYTSIIGQEQLKLALELAYVAPRIGGVLISGERGTAKSTIVRAFAKMMYNHLPVTIPINATEDRVIGGWKIDELMMGKATPKKGLLEEAHEKLLYIDEVNLLDDHIVNIILDVTSTGVLEIQREGKDEQKQIHFTLVGTMNPEEGSLRPQLLDRFGLMVQVTAIADLNLCGQILQAVYAFDEACDEAAKTDWNNWTSIPFFQNSIQQEQKCKAKIKQAHQNRHSVKVPESIIEMCLRLSKEFQAEGHRSDYLLARAAQAYAAIEECHLVETKHLTCIAPLVLQHRRQRITQLNRILWNEEDNNLLTKITGHVPD
jgi:magnesium chelatase subunit I